MEGEEKFINFLNKIKLSPFSLHQLCLENNYNPLIFPKKPEDFNMVIFFGAMPGNSTKKCPLDKSKLKIRGSFNVKPILEPLTRYESSNQPPVTHFRSIREWKTSWARCRTR